MIYNIPDYFVYQISELGYMNPLEREEKEVALRIQTSQRVAADPGINNSVPRTERSNMEIPSKLTRLIMRDVPSLKDEPFCDNEVDVPGRIKFQLISAEFPGSAGNVYGSSYENMNDELLVDNSFGDRLNKGSFIQKKLGDLTSETFESQAQEVYAFISSHYSWNGTFSYFSSRSSRVLFDEAVGNSAEINFALISTLRAYGFEAYPVILSTRGSGKISPAYPAYQDFNHVIAAVFLEGKVYYADAASRLPFGVIDKKCRNGQGFLVSKNGGQLVDLMDGAKYSMSTLIHSAVAEGQLNSTATQILKGYSSLNVYELKEDNNMEEFESEIEQALESETVSDFVYKDISPAQSKVEFQYTSENDSEDVIYMQPIPIGSIKSNPLTAERRFAVVDFPYEQSYSVVSTIDIPEGYSAELGEAAVVKLPNNKGRFIYSAKQEGSQVKVISQVKIKENLFSLEEYPALQQFYQMVVDKNSEPIVLKK